MLLNIFCHMLFVNMFIYLIIDVYINKSASLTTKLQKRTDIRHHHRNQVHKKVFFLLF